MNVYLIPVTQMRIVRMLLVHIIASARRDLLVMEHFAKVTI